MSPVSFQGYSEMSKTRSSSLSTSNTAPGVSVSKTNDSKNSLRGIHIGDASVNDLESDRSTNIREIVSTMKGSCKLTTAPTNLTNGNLLHVDANIFSIILSYLGTSSDLQLRFLCTSVSRAVLLARNPDCKCGHCVLPSLFGESRAVRFYPKDYLISPVLAAYAVSEGMPANINSMRIAARYGLIAGMHWLRDLDPPCPWDSTVLYAAAEEGQLQVLQWMRDPVRVGGACPVDKYVCDYAAAAGHLDCLSYLKSQNAPVSAETLNAAAENDQLEIVTWLRSQDPPCPWNEWTMSACAGAGRLRIMKSIREGSGPCPWDEDSCSAAAQNGQLSALHWLREQQPPCPWDSTTINYACENGHLEIIKFLRSDPQALCPWTSDAPAAAAEGGHMHVLQWLRAQTPPAPWDEDVCSSAAGAGHLAILQWLQAQRPAAPWSEMTATMAAANGHEHVLQWLREQPNFPYPVPTIDRA